MITEASVMSAIEWLKELPATEHTKLVFEFAHKQREVSQFINGGHYRVINVTERHYLNDYIFYAYRALQSAYGDSSFIDTRAITRLRDSFLDSAILTQSVTTEPILEERLKLLIHGNRYVRMKSVLPISATVCAFIELYDKNGK